MAIFSDLCGRDCPVCGHKAAGSRVLLARNLDETKLSATSFASRKNPEFMSFGFVVCATCQTAFAPRIPPTALLTAAYQTADFDSAAEAVEAARSYALAVAAHLPHRREALLEIGSGTGDFLRAAAPWGFSCRIGIEPSPAALAAAPEDVRPFLRETVFRGDEVPPESQDMIACFQTMEHVPNPDELVQHAFKLLRSGGRLMLVTHNYQGIVNRLLGAKSPIVDIEHLQLFCPTALAHLLTAAGFTRVTVKPIWNRYALRYWIRLLPLSLPLKTRILKALGPLASFKIALPVGNCLAVGEK